LNISNATDLISTNSLQTKAFINVFEDMQNNENINNDMNSKTGIKIAKVIITITLK